MGTVDDLVSLSDFAWERLRARMGGLTDAELRWRPAPDDPDISLEWRLNHIATLLTEDRNARWLAQVPPSAPLPDGGGMTERLEAAYALWRTVLTSCTDESLAQPLGPRAGFYAGDSRRSFVLHILDELIHHGAEAALLRDLYAHRA
jgi:DinB superfamily